jgi:hypothetical protein
MNMLIHFYTPRRPSELFECTTRDVFRPQATTLFMVARCVQAYGLDPKFVEPIEISLKVIQGVYSGVTTAELDELAAQTGKQA